METFFPSNTKHSYNFGPALDQRLRRLQHCTNVMQMFCVYRVTDCVFRYYTSEGTEHIYDVMGIQVTSVYMQAKLGQGSLLSEDGDTKIK